MKRFLCIHGHFYQPPRENPWLEAIETQDSAFPYHDWNKRIKAECYANNAASRILDDQMRVVDIVSNYAKISFDMGPTLLQWLEKNASETYSAIIEADRLSSKLRSGHGAAMAQAYNHMIMPLASPRDKKTQIEWGIRDFAYRFEREPEGMWLPETAVDLETLDIMASMGIKFTVLAPNQAHRFRKKGSREWYDVTGSKIDPKLPYICNLSSGRKITLFFYDGPISRAVAFERLLDSGVVFAKRLLSGFSEREHGNKLMHIATDGESYGHHHRFGEMALSYAIHHIETNNLARITNYGEFLEMNPPQHEVEIIEHSSWSCVHGIERWRSDCGCNSGGQPDWHQQWREPLRDALDRLRDEIAGSYEKVASKYFKDPWAAREDYIDVILDRSDPSIDWFFKKHSLKRLGRKQRITALKLMELQRHAMLMYTSCGWFFDDISGIETVQVIQYAGRVIQLAKETMGKDYEAEFTVKLAEAKSNVPEHGDGARVYEKFVRPTVLDLEKVAAHYAINSVYEDYEERATIYCYNIHRTDYRKLQAGTSVLVTGRCLITSKITREDERLSFCVLYIGNHDFNCGVRRSVGNKSYKEMTDQMKETFESGSFADAVRLLDTHFGAPTYNLTDLFRDEQRAILDILIRETMEAFEDSYRRMYEENRLLMGFLQDAGVPIPRGFYTAAEFTLNLDLKKQLQAEFDRETIQGVIEEFDKWKVPMDKTSLEFTLKNRLEDMAEILYGKPLDLDTLNETTEMVDVSLKLPLRHNFWLLQNCYFRMAKTIYPDFARRAKADDKKASRWVQQFKVLGEKLNFNLEAVLPAI